MFTYRTVMTCFLSTTPSSASLLFPWYQPSYSWNKNEISTSISLRISCTGHDSRGSGVVGKGCSANYELPRRRVAPMALSAFNALDEQPLITIPVGLPEVPNGNGIGISKFLHGKNYLITGATGFLGKVLLEKLLRSTPTVGKVYLLIKAADREAATKRLQSEIIDSELFVRLKQTYGDSYGDFMKNKLVTVVGDASQPSLGIDADLAEEIANEVDVIVNSAGNTTFNERYDVAINVNIKGPSRLLNLAKMCKKLKVFVHVSTAYANGEREGVISEKPFNMGDSIAAEKARSDGGDSFFQPLDVDAEIDLASKVASYMEKDNAVTHKMKQLGLERAKTYGWKNTYEFTKAMAEMVLNSSRGDIPIVIMRPTIIESTLSEPVPGWIKGNRMIDPFITLYVQGYLPGFLVDPQVVLDVVPADIVVNATLAAMASHGNEAKPGLNIYHISSSVVNPLNGLDVFKYALKYYNTTIKGTHGKKHLDEFQIFTSMESFRDYVEDISKHKISELTSDTDVANTLTERLEKVQKKRMELFIVMAKMYLPYSFYNGRFDNSNIQKLITEMSDEETREFGVDVEGVDWEDYFVNVHIPGLMKYVVKDDARKT